MGVTFEILVLFLLILILAACVWIGTGIYYLAKTFSESVEVVDAKGEYGLLEAAERAQARRGK